MSQSIEFVNQLVGMQDSSKFLAQFEAPSDEFNKAWNHIARVRLIHMILCAVGRQKGVKWLHAKLEQWAKVTGLGRDIYHVSVVYFWVRGQLLLYVFITL